MKEIEVKILNIDLGDVRRKLEQFGATKMFDGEIKMVTLEHSIINIDPGTELLRIRQVGDKVELCYKKKDENKEVRSSEEIEVTTNNYENTIAIFKKLGFIERYNGEKKRESYTKEKIHFEIDTYPHFPSFLEIEAPTQEELVKTVEVLGFTMEETTTKHSGELFEHVSEN